MKLNEKIILDLGFFAKDNVNGKQIYSKYIYVGYLVLIKKEEADMYITYFMTMLDEKSNNFDNMDYIRIVTNAEELIATLTECVYIKSKKTEIVYMKSKKTETYEDGMKMFRD